jgi:hypothetical protein
VPTVNARHLPMAHRVRVDANGRTRWIRLTPTPAPALLVGSSVYVSIVGISRADACREAREIAPAMREFLAHSLRR